MAKAKAFVEPPQSQKHLIQGFKIYVEKNFGSFNFSGVRYIRPDSPIFDSIVKMEREAGNLKEGEELGGCCGRLPTGETVIYLVNKHKRGHKLPSFGLLYEMIHLAKHELSPEEIEQEASKHFNSAMKYAKVFAYNAVHKRKKPYPK
ncbi:MAG: hypothetical protein JSV51_02340 [Candidatus Bathyarchaeota archaeon]|nr:MAG: hypothetical protein JSV51_02340 [Candidatus Bathyarchaeota archaeon]